MCRSGWSQRYLTLPRWQTRTEAPTWEAKSIDRLVWRTHCSLSRLSAGDGWKKFGAAWSTPMGSGQKLCVEPTFTIPSSTAFRMPGTSVIRIPWLSSTRSKPRSAISRSIA